MYTDMQLVWNFFKFKHVVMLVDYVIVMSSVGVSHTPLASVSGLGMSTGGLSVSVRFRNSHSPMMYCIGILYREDNAMNIPTTIELYVIAKNITIITL